MNKEKHMWKSRCGARVKSVLSLASLSRVTAAETTSDTGEGHKKTNGRGSGTARPTSGTRLRALRPNPGLSPL